MKVFTIVVLAIAIIMGLLVSFLPQERLADVIYISRFFDVMIPILAVGALVKYLATCPVCSRCKTKDQV